MKNSFFVKEIHIAELITRESRQDQALHAREENYRDLLDFTPDAFIQGDREGNIMTVNKKAAELTGFSRTELLLMKIVDLFPPQIPYQTLFADDHTNLGETLLSETKITRKDGQIIQVEMHSRINYKGFPQCFASEFTQHRRAEVALRENEEKLREITERKRAEELLKASEEKFRQLIEHSIDMVILTDANKIQQFVSESCETILGYRPEELTNISALGTLIHPEDQQKVLELYQGTTDKANSGTQYRHRHKNGGWVYLEAFSTNQLSNPFIHSFVLNVRDITAHKQTEQALLESEALLKKLNATKDNFFSIIGHELKSPFNNIMGFSNLLAQQVQKKSFNDLEKYAAIIQDSSKRALALLRNLLEWSRSQTGNMVFTPENIEIVDLMQKVTDLLKDAAQQKSITISKIMPPSDFIFADKEMIYSTLRNLVSNAIKFTDHGGKIIISAHQNQEEWVISISDNGTGIPPEALGKLFRIDQSYSTVGTENERGTGLGLILCQEFVEKHGGKIWVESEFGKGSKFSFSIPLSSSLSF